MQKVAAYLLEGREQAQRPDERVSEFARIRRTVDAWLTSKGADVSAQAGPYQAEDRSRASFKTSTAQDGDREWWLVQLDEITPEGRVVRVTLSITKGASQVVVYSTVELGSESTTVRPVQTIPRCPRVIRDLINLSGAWYHGATKLQKRRNALGFDAGEALAGEIIDPNRTIPIVVLSTEQGVVAVPKLDVQIARDLAGLANVVVADSGATWGLTDTLGQGFSCFDGAVRLYWPRFSTDDDRFKHPLWTAHRIRSSATVADKQGEPLRERLRMLVMDASALGVVRPKEIDEIKQASERRVFDDLRARAVEREDFVELANLSLQENDALRAERKEILTTIEEQQRQIAGLQLDLENLRAQLRHAQQRDLPDDPAPPPDDGALPEAPARGEFRFYKKVHDTGRRDIMVAAEDCNHNRWQSASKADKARKGIAHLEKQNNWKTMWHCGECRGGGMWKVHW